MCVCVCVCVCVCSMVEVEEVFTKKGAELSEVVRPIREVNRKHQQVHMCTLHSQPSVLMCSEGYGY